MSTFRRRGFPITQKKLEKNSSQLAKRVKVQRLYPENLISNSAQTIGRGIVES